MISRRSFTGLPAGGAAFAQSRTPGLPNVGLTADTGPIRSESGIGALMPWADVLWAINYNSHTRTTGTGLALWRINEKLEVERAHVHNGTHANRFVHKQSNQMVIGPYAIDLKGNFKFLEQFRDHRLTATIPHLKDPANMVYMLTMEGLLFEMDMSTFQSKLVADLVQECNINKRPHFKGAWTQQGRVVAANNGFYEFGENEAGLFEWDGRKWNAISRKPHMDCAGRNDMATVIFCTGWDESSVLFWALVKGTWQRYRLPKASHAFDHAWQTEWMRIREVETEHYMVDIHGMFYELQPIAFQDRIWGVKPVCQHLRIIPDYCAFRGLLALAGNQNTPNGDNNAMQGQPQAGIWFGKTDDLWSWGKPQGWGGPWRKTAVSAGEVSDPFLMTGFDKKVLHLQTDKLSEIDIEVDFLGLGEYVKYDSVVVSGYKPHVFPQGFSAHWVRLRSQKECVATAEFMYT